MKKTYKELPMNYPVCGLEDCPMADSCLHRQAFIKLIETENFLRLINPRHCDTNASCKYYRSNTPVLFARGFVNFQQKMFPEQYQTFMRLLIAHFGRNPYFERRRGAYPLPPKEQEVILKVLRQAGVTEDLRFDSYEENINWND